MIGDRWGVTDEEVRRRYGCDDLAPEPTLQAWRGVTVHAEPTRVWARVRQVRLAPYSYDLVDNLGRRSPQELRDVQEPQVGDAFTRAFGRDQGEVVAVVPARELTARIMGAHMTYAVEPGADGTRLLLKIVAGTHRWLAPALSVGDLVMARKQLLTLKRLAEGD
ncbi:polyketide cyclase [Nocardioides hwasunensis]|uniref:Polyketide cyclase n=1 Tax=Nocardioides hwasunensis TaxID=397258 RepID=A0ABR8MC30_9ACTN|nr:polyketide cyclase [Nocardioides hwasunensis]MBD3913487.1 polyketide cyclase [Nocardioides hwasunensis]